MKNVVNKSVRWTVPALAVVFAGGTVCTSFADPNVKTDHAVKAPVPKSKTASGTIAAVDASQIKLTTKEGEVASNIVPTTVLYRLTVGVPVEQIQIGDTLRLPLKGTEGLPTVQSLTPLTLKFGEEATLTFTKSDKLKFDRVTKVTSADLVVGQEAKVASNVFPDGKLEAKEVWATVVPPKAEKPKTAKPA